MTILFIDETARVEAKSVADSARRGCVKEKTGTAIPPPVPVGGEFADVTVMVTGNADLMECWVRAWEASPNAGLWPVMVGWDDSFPEDLKVRLAMKGYTLFDRRPELKRAVGAFSEKHGLRFRTFAAKALSMMRCPTRYCLWLDHDIEVIGDIAPIVRYAKGTGKWICAPVYESMPPRLYVGKRVAQLGVMFVDARSLELARWFDGAVAWDCPNDEKSFHRVFGGWDEARAAIGDLYRPEWYNDANCHASRSVEDVLSFRPLPVLRHWCSKRGKPLFKSLYEKREGEFYLPEARSDLRQGPDIIIPLGPGSKCGNDELKIFLRSIVACGEGYGEILVVTDCPPSWLVERTGLRIVHCGDPYPHNKDANLFHKVAAALMVSRTPDVIYTADDRAVLKPCDFATLPPVYSGRKARDFKGGEDGPSKWQKRMLATLEELGMEEVGNWDTHCPQRWNAAAARAAIADTPYTAPEGRCINTAIMGRWLGCRIPNWAVAARSVKETCEDAEAGKRARLDKVFVGYNDAGFIDGGLRERLLDRFGTKSPWEK